MSKPVRFVQRIVRTMIHTFDPHHLLNVALSETEDGEIIRDGR